MAAHLTFVRTLVTLHRHNQGGGARIYLIREYMALGEPINVLERIEDNAGDMYYAVCFWRNARV